MELIYNVSLEVEIDYQEANLFYKYISLHPEYKHYITVGHFAADFNMSPSSDNLQLILTKEILDICLAVLEDQEFNDPKENVKKNLLIDKLYDWSALIYKEEEIIDDLRLEYDYFLCSKNVSEYDYFSLKKYFHSKWVQSVFPVQEEVRGSKIYSKVKNYLGL